MVSKKESIRLLLEYPYATLARMCRAFVYGLLHTAFIPSTPSSLYSTLRAVRRCVVVYAR